MPPAAKKGERPALGKAASTAKSPGSKTPTPRASQRGGESNRGGEGRKKVLSTSEQLDKLETAKKKVKKKPPPEVLPEVDTSAVLDPIDATVAPALAIIATLRQQMEATKAELTELGGDVGGAAAADDGAPPPAAADPAEGMTEKQRGAAIKVWHRVHRVHVHRVACIGWQRGADIKVWQGPAIHHQSPITHHPSSITHHPSSITHHPSPIIHHPSPITHHPSPLTPHPQQGVARAGERQPGGDGVEPAGRADERREPSPSPSPSP